MPEYDENGNPVAAGGSIRVGETKTFGGDVYQWDGKRWYNTGVRDVPEPKQTAPGVAYDANGKAFYWGTGIDGRPAPIYLGPDFDNPTKAAGYHAPTAGPAPRYPTSQVTPTGDIYRVDPYTGDLTYVRTDPRLATGFSPEEQRANTLADRADDRAYDQTVRTGDRAFTSGENAIDRSFRASESGLDRAINSGQFAASLAAQNQRDKMAAQQAHDAQVRQFQQDQLGAANQFATLISGTDPGALPAFYAAGGGTIANALARGKTAQTDTANLPAARTLQAKETAVAPGPFTWTDYVAPTPPPQAFSAPAPTNTGAAAPPPDPTTAARTEANSRMDSAGVPDWVPRFARGTYRTPTFATGSNDFIPAPPAFRVGDSPSGMPTGREELVQVDDPEGNAQVKVTPDDVTMPDEQPFSTGVPASSQSALVGDVLTAVGKLLVSASEQGGAFQTGVDGALRPPPVPAFALGTYTGTMADELVQEGDQPYLDRVRDIRNSVDIPDANPFSVGFANIAPSVRNRFFAGRQTKYGIPVTDQQFEQQRFALPGTSRGAFSLGI